MEDMNHAEDLCFYLSIAKDRIYDYTSDTILIYRERYDSAMTNYLGLEEGYYKLFQYIRSNNHLSVIQSLYIRLKIMRIMFLTYLVQERNLAQAIRSFYQYITM